MKKLISVITPTYNEELNIEKLIFAVEKIIQIADSADPVLKQQAHAFREKMYWVIVHTAKQAIKSDRTTLQNNLANNGQEDLAKLLRTI